jgi:hypothetical protein
MELNLQTDPNNNTPEKLPVLKPGTPPENEALEAIMMLENDLRALMEKTKEETPEERARKFEELYKDQIHRLNKMMEVASLHMARKLQNCAVPQKTGGEIISLAYDMVNFGIAVSTRQLAAMQNGINLGENDERKLARPDKEYSPIILQL